MDKEMTFSNKRGLLKQLVLAAVFFGISVQVQARFKVIGYIWSRGNMVADLQKVDLTKVTHLNIAFINPGPEGEFTDLPALDTVMAIAREHHVKVLMSCGGGRRHAYYARLLTEEHRSRLISNFIAYLDKYQLDGIDVDLEGDDIDSNYEAFIVGLRKPLSRRKKLLTAAVAWWTRDRMTDKALAQFDFINIMAYDKTGPWKPENPGQHSPMSYAQEHLAYWHKERGLKKKRLNLGLPFYGYGFGELPDADPLFRNITWQEVLEKYPGRKDFDEIVLPDNGGTLYYNGISTIRQKTELAVKEGGGVMIWQLLHDSFNEDSLLDLIDRTWKASGKRRQAGGQPSANTAGDSFRVKGFHLDLRIQVMKMQALKDFALKLSKNGINTLVMEWEASYPYEKHRIISSRYAYSREEVRDFIDYCESLHIDVIPLQQSFGHVEYILKHPRYKELREDQKDYSQVNPLKEELCRALFTDLFKDMAAMHKSDYLHIGGDETYLLGHSEESKKKVAEVGKGRLYGDYLKLMCDIVVSLGKRPVVWADIALKYPDALKSLPKETIFVDWNYGWALDRFGDHRKLMESGFEIWGAPSIRSQPDNYFITQWDKHFNNIGTFIPQARELGYKGMVMTSWSTSGIYSPVFESSTDMIDLYAIRRVYPISGFNMLIDAYFKAVNDSAFNAGDFIRDYALTHYGLDEKDASAFRKAICSAPYEINQGKVIGAALSVKQLLDSAQEASSVLNALRPQKGKNEFEHYRLMADIRCQYLRYMLAEEQVNAEGFRAEDAPRILKQLNAIHTKKLDRRFIKLNKAVLYPSELKTENELRNSRIELLKEKLSGEK